MAGIGKVIRLLLGAAIDNSFGRLVRAIRKRKGGK